jgi:poly(3-hydroxybutyrate) depolymerase
MLFRMLLILSVAALGLVLAACAETGSAMASAMATEAAEVAATQAAIATTQAIDQLEAAATQSSVVQLQATGKIVPMLPSSGGQGNLIIDTPQMTIIQQNGKRYIIVKPQYQWDPNWQNQY